ncbi:N-acetyltransferase family protein [Neobacillus sp. Marseille-QA0830]
MDQLTIRDAELNDLPAIVEIYNTTIPGGMVTADLEPVSVETRLPWFNEHSAGYRPLWVVEDGETICAWISFQSFYGRPAYNHTAEISIYIHEQYRGKKLGRFLMEKAISESPELNIKTILGFIFAHNEPSMRLFAGFGFEKWAHLPKVAELDGIERDLIIMGKRIVD